MTSHGGALPCTPPAVTLRGALPLLPSWDGQGRQDTEIDERTAPVALLPRTRGGAGRGTRRPHPHPQHPPRLHSAPGQVLPHMLGPARR
jgi:hypothetical protein